MSLFNVAPPRTERSSTDVAVTVLCIASVAVGAVFHRKAGTCGTGHYLAFQMVGAILISLVEELVQTRYDALLASIVAYILNVAAFSLLIRAWYRRASRERYVIGALALTGFYLLSYFFLLPTVDCP